MQISSISTKGQITLPARMRRSLGIRPQDRLCLELTGNTITIKRVGDFFELEGFLGKRLSEKKEQVEMMRGVARHVEANEK